MDKSKRFSLMAPKTPSDDGSFHHRRVASADAEPNGTFGSTLDRDSRNAPSGELQPLLSLVSAHSKKTYFSGYLAARTVRLENGKPTKPGDSRSELQGVFVKLIGTVLNVWVRRDMEAAAAQGSAVPPKCEFIHRPRRNLTVFRYQHRGWLCRNYRQHTRICATPRISAYRGSRLLAQLCRLK